MKPQTIKEVNIFDADILDKIEEVSILLKEYFAIDNKMLPKRIWSTFFEKDSLTSEKNSECLELAKFVRFIKLCGGENNQYLIQSTNKGIAEKINISGYLLKLLLLSAERELSFKMMYERGEFIGNTEHDANVIYDEDYKDEEMSKILASLRENYHKHSKHRYNLKELNNIIEEGKKGNSGYYDFRRTEKLGWMSINILGVLYNYGIKQTELTQTKLYSFVYDTLVIRGVESDKGKGFSGVIGAEKKTKVRDYIKAYIKRYDKLEGMRFRDGLKINYAFDFLQ